MSGVDEVVGLLKELRDSRGVLGRAAVLARGAAAMRDLTVEQKRELAVKVAERAAPQLVPRIEAETGMDLTPAQVSAVMDLALRMDREKLDDLITTIESPDAREAVGREVLGAVGRELDDELDLGLLPPPPTAAAAATGAGAAAGLAGERADDVEREVDGLASELDEEDEDIAALRAELEETRREVAELEAMEADVAEGIGALEGLVDDDAAHQAADGFDHDAEDTRDAGSVAVPVPTGDDALHRGSPTTDAVADLEPEDLEPDLEPDDPASDDVATDAGPDREAVRAAERIVASARAATSAGAALRAVTAGVDRLAHATSTTRTAAVRAVPDGWARRRAVQRLLDASAVGPDEALPLVRLLERESDRVWVLGAMIDLGLAQPADAAGLVRDRAAERLARRGP